MMSDIDYRPFINYKVSTAIFGMSKDAAHPSYTDDWHYAWRIVEKMQEKGWIFNIESPLFAGDYWRCSFGKGFISCEEFGINPRILIAVTALKALGVFGDE